MAFPLAFFLAAVALFLVVMVLGLIAAAIIGIFGAIWRAIGNLSSMTRAESYVKETELPDVPVEK